MPRPTQPEKHEFFFRRARICFVGKLAPSVARFKHHRKSLAYPEAESLRKVPQKFAGATGIFEGRIRENYN